jgi:hypothetical protein
MILSFRNMLEGARKSSYFYSEAETKVWRHTGDAFSMRVTNAGIKRACSLCCGDAIMVRMSTYAMGSVPFVSS